jgi:ParB-like chromosome segregation protein Spo0J
MTDNVITDASSPELLTLPLSGFQREERLWPRQGLDPARVREFAALYREQGAAGLPPIAVAEVGERRFLVDGWHRCAAAEMAGLSRLPVFATAMGRSEDVYWEAVHLSATIGKPLSRGEKRAAVDRLLAAGREGSDHEIARLAGVSQPFVSKRRKLLKAGRPQRERPARPAETETERAARRLVRALVELVRLQDDLGRVVDGQRVDPAVLLAARVGRRGGGGEAGLLRLRGWTERALRQIAGEAEEGAGE